MFKHNFFGVTTSNSTVALAYTTRSGYTIETVEGKAQFYTEFRFFSISGNEATVSSNGREFNFREVLRNIFASDQEDLLP